MKKFKCPQCQNVWESDDIKAEQTIQCPKCQYKFRLHSSRKSNMQIENESETTVKVTGRKREEPEMDMTPMVDVTFLLLIFFMVTASYSIQKSLEIPAPDSSEESAQQTVQDVENDDDYIIVKIERDNSIWVESVEAPSYQDLIAKLKEKRSDRASAPGSLLIMADNEADYEYVVRAVDAGNAVGVNKLKLTVTSEE